MLFTVPVLLEVTENQSLSIMIFVKAAQTRGTMVINYTSIHFKYYR